ncbi:MAG TPA: hypothetical protein VG095_09070 [Chthoniobacterales bacterium]|nr:hypothetical protein [Chthoniobacterales bacterium]
MRRSVHVIASLILGFVLARSSSAATMPPAQELRTLVHESLLAFNQAVQAQDFTAFHQRISNTWQKQITPAQLRESFKVFVDQRIDLSFIGASQPAFLEPPAIDDEGVLTLEGRYPTEPYQVDFRLHFLQEKSAWRLLGVKLNVLPTGSGDAPLPKEKEARRLVLDSLGALNRALREKSFVGFHKQVAVLWQEQTTPEKLQARFQSFIDRDVDFAPLLKLEPRFEKPPALNEDGLLELQGSFATKPDKVSFEFGYLYEPPAWKLIKVNVQIDPGEEE